MNKLSKIKKIKEVGRKDDPKYIICTTTTKDSYVLKYKIQTLVDKKVIQ